MDNNDRFEAAMHVVSARVAQSNNVCNGLLAQWYETYPIEDSVNIYAGSEPASQVLSPDDTYRALQYVSKYIDELMSPLYRDAFEALMAFDADPTRRTDPEYLCCRQILLRITERWGNFTPNEQVELAEYLAGARHTAAFIQLIESLIEGRRIYKARLRLLHDTLASMKDYHKDYKPSKELNDFLSRFKVIEKGVGGK